VTIVLAWLWQGIALAGAIALILRCARRLNAATRHVVWWATLSAVILLPLLSFFGTEQPHRSAAFPGSDSLMLPAVPTWLLIAGGAFWACHATHRLFRVARSASLIRRLKEHSWPLPADREARLQVWTTIRQPGRSPALRLFAGTGGACALGLGHPVILVSDALASRLTDEELDLIVIHEHAHLARFDDWGRLAQAILAALVDLHPAVRFIASQIDLEREAACDDHVVASTGKTREFAQCLIAVAESTRDSFATALIPAATKAATDLRYRVHRLLERRRNHDTRVFRRVSAGAALILVATLGGLSQLPPVVDFHPARHADIERLPVTSASSQGSTTYIPAQQAERGGPVAARVRRSPVRARHVERRIGAAENERSIERRESPEPPPTSLDSTPIGMRFDASISLAPIGTKSWLDVQSGAESTSRSEREVPASSDERRPWLKLADEGSALGGHAHSAGVSLARLLTRRAKALAEKF
jgi:BlaR1 peptidase M56